VTAAPVSPPAPPPPRVPPRVPPLAREHWGAAEREVLGFLIGPELWEIATYSNLMTTLANHPPLGLAYLGFGRQVMERSTLPDRARELLTLRIAAVNDTSYVWHNHVETAREAGINDAEIEAIRTGPAAPVWPDGDRALLRAVDQILARGRVDDQTWAALVALYDTRQLMDLVFTVGHYAMTTWAINVLGIAPDEQRQEMIDHYLRARAALGGASEQG
jgi:4-carboxymuconolactone decarboxylase